MVALLDVTFWFICRSIVTKVLSRILCFGYLSVNILSMEYSVFRNISQIKCNFAFKKSLLI